MQMTNKQNIDEYEDADVKIGSWLSAALEDDNVCAEMKVDITRWFTSRNKLTEALQQMQNDMEEAVGVIKQMGHTDFTGTDASTYKFILKKEREKAQAFLKRIEGMTK